MTAYLNPKELRILADLLEKLPCEFRHGELETEATTATTEGRLAVWWDEEYSVPYVRVMDAAEAEAAG